MRIWNFICGWPKTIRSLCKLRGFHASRELLGYSERTLLIALIAGTVSSTYAAENDENEAAPDLEFLEFLGQFETESGEWIDPESLLAEEFTELLEATSDNNSRNTDDASNDNQ
jgi:hypothetical protein